jgi:hypothetical protein
MKNNTPAGYCCHCWTPIEEGSLVCPDSNCDAQKDTRRELKYFENMKSITVKELSYYLELRRQYNILLHPDVT